jgi:two-component system, cell cycle sensor histidine kinase and response regulator CckA
MSAILKLAASCDVPTAFELDPDLGFRLANHTTVLLVEDDAKVRSMARRILSGQAYRVVEAVNGSDALRLATPARMRVDVVLTDVEMPTIGVRAMLRRLTELYPEIRVVLMSGYGDEELLRRGFDKGHDPFLQKPFTGSELVAAVHEALQDATV